MLQLDIGSLEVTVQKHCAIKTQSQVAVKLATMKIVCTLIVIIMVICRKRKTIKTQSRVAVKLVAMKIVCTLFVTIMVICRKCKNTILEV